MTTTTDVNKVRYEGNGVTDTFAFNGRIFAEGDLVVEIITRATDTLEETLTITTDYTVTISGDESASITVVSGKIPSSLQDIQIRRALTKTQTVDLPVGTVFPAISVENALDRNVSIIQDQSEEIGRAIKLPVTSSLSGINLPLPTNSSVIGWNAAGDDLRVYQFGEISNSIDTIFTSLSTNDYLQYNGTNWVNITPSALSANIAVDMATDLGLKDLATSNINELTAFASIADQSDSVAVYDTSANETKQITYRNFFATIDDISAFNNAPASGDKLVIVNVSNGNANAITHEELMRIDNLTEDTSPDLANDFLLSYDASAGQAKKVKPENVAKSLTSGTAAATTSGTAFDFTSIPSGTKQITINFEDVSTSGSDNLLVQIGDSGGVETTGYVSGCSDSGGNVSSTAGFIIKCNSAGNNVSGSLILNLLDSATNTWVASGGLNVSSLSPRLLTVAGDKSLTAELDRVRLTRSGSDTFDNGKVNINYI